MSFPIVLAHGFARFDILLIRENRPVPEELGYWKNIPKILENSGYKVFQSNVDWAGPVVERAQELAEQIGKYLTDQQEQKVNIIAHSMGGLDARYAIAKFGLAPSVASLTTLCTPHHGSAFADWAANTRIVDSLTRISGLLGIDIKGLMDLTSDACRKRNDLLREFEEENKHNVLYQTYAGAQDITDIFWPLVPSYRIIKREEGPNDGLVAVTSAKWKESIFKGVQNFDHLNFLGWWDPAEWDLVGGRKLDDFSEEIRDFYLSLAKELP